MRANRAKDVDLPDLDVVLIEESKPVQAILRSILYAARIGRIRVFDNAEDGYRAMLVEPPHLLIVAGELGEVDGLTLVRTMRDRRSGPLVSVPVILTSSLPTRRLVERSIAVGVHFVLAKPLSPANVMRRIEAVIHDDRTFVYDETLGFHVLDDHDELLAGQRERWQDLHAGTSVFPVRDPIVAEVPVRPRPVVVERDAIVVPEPKSRHPNALGLSVPIRRDVGETSTGQAAKRTA